METNTTAIKETAKNDVIQADPILTLALLKLAECKAVIQDYSEDRKDNNYDFIKDKAADFDGEIYSCITIIGEMIGYQLACAALESY